MDDTTTTPEPAERESAGNPDVQDDPDDELDQDAEPPGPAPGDSASGNG